MKTLIVMGTFDKLGGHQSLFGGTLIKYFIDCSYDVTCLNGGTLKDLDDILHDIKAYSVIIWMAYVDSEIKYLPKIKKKNKRGLLIQSRRNPHQKYSVFQVVEEMFKDRSNLCLILDYNSEYYDFKLIDPLGNMWYQGANFSEALERMNRYIKYVKSLTRKSSIRNDFYKEEIKIEENFLDIVRHYGQLFSEIINVKINQERHLGNASTRCMFGFPSVRKNGVIFISCRNVDKKIISDKDFIAVRNSDLGIEYSGSIKPSVDTPIQLKLYEYYNNVNYIIHGHVYVADAPKTPSHVPCGYVEEFTEIIRIYRDKGSYNFAINLKGHGCIIFAHNIEYFNQISFIGRMFPEDNRYHHL